MGNEEEQKNRWPNVLFNINKRNFFFTSYFIYYNNFFTKIKSLIISGYLTSLLLQTCTNSLCDYKA